MHGYGIAQRIEQVSHGVFHVNPGRCFRHSAGWSAPGGSSPCGSPRENNRRAKYYALTDRGRKQLKTEAEEWSRQSAAIARILESC